MCSAFQPSPNRDGIWCRWATRSTRFSIILEEAKARSRDLWITGPDYQGAVPGEMTRISTRTKIGVLAVRIFVKGDADLARAIEAQNGFYLLPLSAYLRQGLAFNPPPVVPTSVTSEARSKFASLICSAKRCSKCCPSRQTATMRLLRRSTRSD